MSESDDKEMRSMERAEKKAQALSEKHNYRVTNPQCCLTCKHLHVDYEDLQCELLEVSDTWRTGFVDSLGLCDKYEEEKND